MTVGYVDASCLVAVAFGEPGYQSVIDQLEGLDHLYSSNLLEAELRAAFRRESVELDGSMMERLAWVLPDRPLTGEIRAVLEAGNLRGADLWHLACALYLSPDPREIVFVTMDRQQGAVATRVGFPSMEPQTVPG